MNPHDPRIGVGRSGEGNLRRVGRTIRRDGGVNLDGVIEAVSAHVDAQSAVSFPQIAQNSDFERFRKRRIGPDPDRRTRVEGDDVPVTRVDAADDHPWTRIDPDSMAAVAALF